jgi:hypothetical protein
MWTSTLEGRYGAVTAKPFILLCYFIPAQGEEFRMPYCDATYHSIGGLELVGRLQRSLAGEPTRLFFGDRYSLWDDTYGRKPEGISTLISLLLSSILPS